MGLANTPWPKFRHDSKNTGRSEYASRSDGTLKWMYQTGYSVRSSPAIAADGTIYIGSHDGYLYALNPDGTLKWRYLTGNYIGSSPAIAADGTIYVGSDNRYLYALNPNGTLKWRYLTGGFVRSSPAIAADGTIYIGSHDGYLYALNPDGTLKWRYLTGNYIESSPAIGADGTIYIGSRDCSFYALNPDGTLKWRYLTPTRGYFLLSSPAIGADGTIYIGCTDGYLYALNPDGTLKWRYPTWGGIWSSPAIAADGTIYVGSTDRYLYALNPDGTLKWRYLTGNYIESSPAIGADGTIYIGSRDWYLYAFQSVTNFEVIFTDPTQNASNVDPNTDIQITFSDSLDATTISTDTLQVYGWLPDQYEYQWTYDDGTKTLTLIIPGGLETDASIIVNLTDGLKSTGGVALTPYALGFSTAKMPLQQCDPPVIVEPVTVRCARPMVILQSPVPARPRAKWRLHFRVRAYADEGGTQLIGASDSSTNPELFEYSPDNGLTWNDFPSDGLPREQYGKLIRVRVEVGPRKQVWLKASVGAEDA